MNRRAAFEVVDQFEAALCEYTGAPYCVTVDSCTNALWLALQRFAAAEAEYIELPRHTYVGVVQAALNAGYEVIWTDEKWTGDYMLRPTLIVDSAKRFERGMYQPGEYRCVSFQAGKLLPIGRGGAILHDDTGYDEWFRRARLDGRTAGASYTDATFQQPGYHCYMTPPDAARGLWLLTYIDDNDQGDWTEYPDLSQATWS